MSKKPDHSHCWHYTSGYTNGLAVEGKDTFRCCWCGDFVSKTWTTKQDPEHGGYCDMKIRVYEGGWKQGGWKP